ncbi:MAG TPA: hypothetical protein VGY57_15530, partial [Vicinamibacterales bacterium]|nr:hypothetical protein [Vicinamibacterales bacterium]
VAFDATAAAEPVSTPSPRRRVSPIALVVVLFLLVVAAAEAMRIGVPTVIAPPPPPASPAWTQSPPARLDRRPVPQPPRVSVRGVRHRVRIPPPPPQRPHRSVVSVLLTKLHLVDDFSKR